MEKGREGRKEGSEDRIGRDKGRPAARNEGRKEGRNGGKMEWRKGEREEG